LEKGWHSVTACAFCEYPWPCPDYEDISAALLGEPEGSAAVAAEDSSSEGERDGD
jgi:hypothetical protein